MSSEQFIMFIPIYEGAQCKYYVVDDVKYHLRFPIDWALNHKKFQEGDNEIYTGPVECKNCAIHGSIRGVFIGYCRNCLQYYNDLNDNCRGIMYMPGFSAELFEDEDLWYQYPYMHGVKTSEIGDEEGADLTKNGVNLERLFAAMASAQHDNEDEEETTAQYGELAEENYDDESSVNSGVDSLGNLSW